MSEIRSSYGTVMNREVTMLLRFWETSIDFNC